MKQFLYLCTLLLLISSHVNAQQMKVSGKITDAISGAPIDGASVFIVGKKGGVITNVDGTFSIQASIGQVLKLSSVGYASKDEKIQSSTVNATLTAINASLNEVVVVGYGQQKKANLTGSVITLKQEDLLKRQVATASNLLQGLAPGVTVQQQSGKPGADGASIRIRGLGSIYAGQSPLIIIDGVVSSLDVIDPNAIDNITILKDAASTAIYGARAGNGVVLVTTKRATKKGVQLAYNSYFTQQSATAIPERVNAIDHMELSNLAEQNRTGVPTATVFPQTLIDKYKTTTPNNLDVINTDWLGLVLSNNGLMQNHNLTLTSANDNINVFGSVTYLDQQGLIQNSNYKRYDIRFNPEIKVNDKFSLKGNFGYTNSTTINPSTGSAEFIIKQAIGLPAIGGGLYGPGMYGNAGQSTGRNPIAMAEAAGTSRSSLNSMLSKFGFVYKPIKNLDIEAYWSREYWVPNGKTFVKNVNVYVPNITTGSYDVSTVWPGQTTLSETYSTNIRTTLLSQATYSLKLSNHSFKLLGGAQTEEFTYSGLGGSRTGFNNPDQPYMNLGSGNISNSGSAYETALAGFYSRLNYNFSEKYFIEANGRYDGSSRFSQKFDKQWGFFPSASAGWVFTKEKFLDRISNIVTFGKIRASYGALGNQALSDVYPFAANYETSAFSANYLNGTSYYFNGLNTLGYALLGAPNPGITWEKSIQKNIAIDFSLFNKLNITVDWYKREISDLLLIRPIPTYVGLSSPYVNAGSMENTGLELSLNYKTNIKKLKIDMTANFAKVANKVNSLKDLPFLDGGSIRTIPGEALWSYYGYRSVGYFADSNDVKNSPIQFGSAWNANPATGPKAGDVKYKDVNNDGKVDAQDREVIGNNFPALEFSFNLNLSYGQFDLNLFGQGVANRMNYYSGTGAIPFQSADFAASLLNMHKDYWTPTNSNARFPRLLPSGSGGNNYLTSSQWIKDASFFRLKNVNLGYRLPPSILKKLSIQGFRLFISGQNLFTMTNAWSGFDPEINSQTAEFYPLMRTYTFGLNVNF